jgi:hypothetical protein
MVHMVVYLTVVVVLVKINIVSFRLLRECSESDENAIEELLRIKLV